MESTDSKPFSQEVALMIISEMKRQEYYLIIDRYYAEPACALVEKSKISDEFREKIKNEKGGKGTFDELTNIFFENMIPNDEIYNLPMGKIVGVITYDSANW